MLFNTGILQVFHSFASLCTKISPTLFSRVIFEISKADSIWKYKRILFFPVSFLVWSLFVLQFCFPPSSHKSSYAACDCYDLSS